jgi:hypothetical protein
MPPIALFAAVARQTRAELSPVPERRGTGLCLRREPALAQADLAPTSLVALPVRKPALDIPLSHDRA